MAQAMTDGHNQTPEEAARARRMRNIVLALVLGFFVVLLFVMTVVRLGGHVAD